MNKVKVLFSASGVKNRVVKMKADPEEFKGVIGDMITRTPITQNIYVLSDYEAVKKEKAPNMLICAPNGQIKKIMAGTLIFVNTDENGGIIDLTEEDLSFLEKHIEYFTDDKTGKEKTIYKRIYLNGKKKYKPFERGE